MPQFNYTHPALQLGQVATDTPYSVDSYVNELLAQESEVTIAAAPPAGDYTIQLDGPEGSFSFTYTSPGAETEAQIVAGLLLALQADPDLVNVVVGTDASPVLELDFIHPGAVWVISFPSNPGGNMSQALIQAAGGVDVHLGVGVVPGNSAEFAVAPSGGTVDGDFLGITVALSVDVQVNDGLSTSFDVFAPGATLSVMEAGEAVVEVEDAVAFNGDVFMRIANPGPGQHLGAFRSDNAGGDAIQITRAKFRTATSGAGLARVKVNRP